MRGVPRAPPPLYSGAFSPVDIENDAQAPLESGRRPEDVADVADVARRRVASRTRLMRWARGELGVRELGEGAYHIIQSHTTHPITHVSLHKYTQIRIRDLLSIPLFFALRTFCI